MRAILCPMCLRRWTVSNSFNAGVTFPRGQRRATCDRCFRNPEHKSACNTDTNLVERQRIGKQRTSS